MEAIVPEASALSSSLTLCSGSSVTLDLTIDGASSVVWSPLDGLDDASLIQPEASPTSPTTYVASVLDECGVVTDLSIQVDVLTPPTLDLPDTVLVCTGAVVSLTVDSEDGFAPL